MTIDMSRFQQAFFEESIEGLDVMEAELLRIDRDEHDAETINVIFRAAHSIKGGAGTFGFPSISDYTHVMETLLDEMRNGQREITHQGIQVLLESADILRALILAEQSHSDVDQNAVDAQQQKLQALLENRLGRVAVLQSLRPQKKRRTKMQMGRSLQEKPLV